MSGINESAGPFSIGSDLWPGVSKLIEEMGELNQVLGKLMGTGGNPSHWDGSNLIERMEEEIADVRAALMFVSEHNPLNRDRIRDRVIRKADLFDSWHTQQACAHSTLLFVNEGLEECSACGKTFA